MGITSVETLGAFFLEDFHQRTYSVFAMAQLPLYQKINYVAQILVLSGYLDLKSGLQYL